MALERIRKDDTVMIIAGRERGQDRQGPAHASREERASSSSASIW
jgi:hypothetical protein